MDQRALKRAGRVAVYTRFAERVSALDDEAWQRLVERTAAIDGSAFEALVGRARLATRSMLPDIRLDDPPLTLRAINGALRGIMTGIHAAAELASEFESAPAVRGPYRRTTSTGNPTSDAYRDAYYRIEEALIPFASHQGLSTAVHAAGRVTMLHDFIAPESFAQVYGFIEPEIPYASVAAGG